MEELQREKEHCRVCASEELYVFLDFGPMPLTNAFLEAEDEETQWFPLEVVHCNSCSHVQLRHTVDRSYLFSEYPYQSSASDSIPDHFTDYAEEVQSKFLSPGDRVVEIGSNDGTLLRQFDERVETIGVDPATNVATIAEERGVKTVTELFDADTATTVKREFGPASVIVANNVLGHVDDLHGFLEGVDHLLQDDGTFIVEVPYLLDLINNTEFDTIYHEHLSYFSLRSLQALVEQYGMCVRDVKRVDTHGGSIRAYVRYETAAEPAGAVASLTFLELAHGLDQQSTYDRFSNDVARLKDRIRSVVEGLAEQGHSIAGYGAPSKANVLLNYADIDREHVDYIVDTTPTKQDTYTPGKRIPVRDPEVFHEDPPDYALLFAWNYESTVLSKERSYREAGGQFIVPVPYVNIV